MKRFSKSTLLAELDRHVLTIAMQNGFDLMNGTSQLSGDIDEAVEYGKMIAFERLAERIRKGDL